MAWLTRSLAAVAFLAIGVIFSPVTIELKLDDLKSPTLSTYLKLARQLSFPTSIGYVLWLTFTLGTTMFKSLRRQFGNLQSKMFPAYFTMVGICLAISVVSFWYLHPWSFSSADDKFHFDFLLPILAFNLTSIFVLIILVVGKL